MSKTLLFPESIMKKGYQEEQTGRIYKCYICGKSGPWDENNNYWRYIFHYGDRKNGDPGWEELVVMCSRECKAKAEEKIKWRQQ